MQNGKEPIKNKKQVVRELMGKGLSAPQEKEVDMVNHPPHYTKGKYETIDVIMDVTQHLGGREGYLVGNIIKYLSRYYFKNGIEDIKKAQWYLNKLLEVIKSE